jgi:hypothetical protein
MLGLTKNPPPPELLSPGKELYTHHNL